MPDFSAVDVPLVTFGVFIGLLLALAWLSRLVSLQIQKLIYRLTGSVDAATVTVFLFFLPGVLVHEFAHWLMARVLGLKTSRFRVWPEAHGKYIGMGSVHISSGGPLRDSLVGLAPLLAGSGLVAAVGTRIFETPRLIAAWTQGDWPQALLELPQSFGQPDGMLWAYLLFAVANAMMPSASDRDSVKSLGLYVLLAALLYFLLDLPLHLLGELLQRLVGPIQLLSSALLFTLGLDVALLTILFLLESLATLLRH